MLSRSYPRQSRCAPSWPFQLQIDSTLMKLVFKNTFLYLYYLPSYGLVSVDVKIISNMFQMFKSLLGGKNIATTETTGHYGMIQDGKWLTWWFWFFLFVLVGTREPSRMSRADEVAWCRKMPQPQPVWAKPPTKFYCGKWYNKQYINRKYKGVNFF